VAGGRIGHSGQPILDGQSIYISAHDHMNVLVVDSTTFTVTDTIEPFGTGSGVIPGVPSGWPEAARPTPCSASIWNSPTENRLTSAVVDAAHCPPSVRHQRLDARCKFAVRQRLLPQRDTIGDLSSQRCRSAG
jgi:hypothetical protein